MTYPAPDKIPYDEWFHDPPHPYDNWPMATDKEEKKEEITMHEKMYRLATEKHSPWAGGGSENFNHPKT